VQQQTSLVLVAHPLADLNHPFIISPNPRGKSRTLEMSYSNNTTTPLKVNPPSLPHDDLIRQTTQAFEGLNVSGISPPTDTEEENLLAQLVEVRRQYEIYSACHKHRGILRQSICRNLELIDLYVNFCRAAGSDKRHQSTCDLYRRLSGELEVANLKLTDLEASLAARSSTDLFVFERESQRLNDALQRLRNGNGNGYDDGE
jgi:hypothetical protein